MRVYFYFFQTFFQYSFTSNRYSFLIWEDLLKKFSFRYSENEKNKYRIFFTYLKLALKTIIKSKKTKLQKSKNILLLDLSIKAEKERREYINRLIKNKSFDFLVKVNLPNNLNLIEKIINLVLVINIFNFTIFLSFFYKNKGNLALLTIDYVELLLLSKILKKNDFEKIIFFSAYEKDTVFVTNFVKNHLKIPIQLVPSPNPIHNFYQHVICTEFTFTVPYQKNEFEKLKQNWIIDSTIDWPPSGFSTIINTINRTTTKNTIGYISSGIWLRKELGHNDLNKGFIDAEDNIIELLKKIISKNNQIKIIISLHPLEKRNESNLLKSKLYYSEKFGKQIDFFPFDKKTNELPEYFDIGISPFSSAMFERLFAGYKIIFSQNGMDSNYFFDERLSKITANNYETFETLLNDVLIISNDDFFEKYDLTEYKYNSQTILN